MTNQRHGFRINLDVVRIVALTFLTALVLVSTQQLSLAQNITVIASTVPANGDLNPYGVARVPRSTGALVEGNILVSNFNNSANLQGTGTTIVQISPNGEASLFAQIDASKLPGPCPGGVGLTTALSVLRTGWVIVGSLPTTDGTASTAQAGCLIVLDSSGNVAETFSNSFIDGPWDMTAKDGGSSAALFVTNVLNGTVVAGGSIVHGGIVIRLDLSILNGAKPILQSITTIGSGFATRTDPAALVIGPTGLALSKDGSTLYVADSLRNRIQAISDPLTRVSTAHLGTTLTHGGSLNDPLGLALAINGDILAVNGNNGYLTEITPAGQQVSKTLLDSSGTPPGAGALFGLIDVRGQGIYYVDDATNTLNLFR
ncbi:MAG TPA: SMP-30/gluconolactonase/LRE family protein [Terriglobales bacterium]|nr:SMP-30/gluconolactonase/LRE family protein [Terriglobales bacterium]